MTNPDNTTAGTYISINPTPMQQLRDACSPITSHADWLNKALDKLEGDIKAKDARIAELEAALDTANEVIAANVNHIGDQAAKIAELEKALTETTICLAGVKKIAAGIRKGEGQA